MKTDGALDFYCNSSLKFAFELLVSGDRVGAHLKRFNSDGIYQDLEMADHLVVNFCRSEDGKPTNVNRGDDLVTVFFKKGGLSRCTCLYRNEADNLTFDLST